MFFELLETLVKVGFRIDGFSSYDIVQYLSETTNWLQKN
jgi:hypothetical protein